MNFTYYLFKVVSVCGNFGSGGNSIACIGSGGPKEYGEVREGKVRRRKGSVGTSTRDSDIQSNVRGLEMHVPYYDIHEKNRQKKVNRINKTSGKYNTYWCQIRKNSNSI